MKNFIKTTLTLLLMLALNSAQAQKYFSKTGNISFSSITPIEDIEGVSNSASTVFDLTSGKIQWAVLIKSFEFEKALMQEHFNENYMESTLFPKAKFSGSIVDSTLVDLSKDGTYTVDLIGNLTIHGVTNEIATQAQFTVNSGLIEATSQLKIMVDDYNIKIPSVVKSNIAEVIDVNINTNYEMLDKS